MQNTCTEIQIVFFNLTDLLGKKIRGKKLEITIEIAQDAANLCTQFLKPPMELTYEKTMMQFILLAKKRYVGILYEKDPNKGKMKIMGLSIKRRDSDHSKDTYGGILNILMKEDKITTNINPNHQNIKGRGKEKTNIDEAIQFLQNSLLELKNGKVPMDKLSITKALNVLPERIGDRDQGNKPKSGDRIQFIYIVHKNKKALQ